MQRFDVLSRTLNVFDTHFLEASAGTGKTFAIEHLLVRLLIEGDHPLLIDQILVVTFTRAATRQLRVRVRRNLIATLESLKKKGDGQSVDYIQAICEQGSEAIELATRRVQEALICFDQAQIFTVHGFCHRILKEFAFDARVPFDVSDPDSPEYLGLLEQGVKDFLRTGLIFPSYSSSQIKRAFQKFHHNFEKMCQRMVSCLAQEKEIELFPSFQELHREWQKELIQLPLIEYPKWLSDYNEQKVCYKEMRKDHFDRQASFLGSLIAKKECTMEEFDRLLKEKDFFLEKMEKENLKVRAQFPPHLHYPDLIAQMFHTLLPFLQAAKDSKKIFLRMLKDCQRRNQSLSQNHQIFSPDALLKQMQLCLDSENFVSKVRLKYKAAIIDEFQDTDPIQWDIFQRLFVGKVDAMCLVGDPKQSIYAFRNADVYTYISAAELIGEKCHKYLDTNFRSQAGLVKALNHLFRLTQGWIHLPAWNRTLDVPEVKAASHENRGGVHFFVAEASSSFRTKRWPTKETEEEALFPFIAKEMIALAGSEMEWDRFAILVKDRFQAQRCFEFLKRYQIPAALKRGGDLTETRAFYALYELLDAACFSSDLSKMKKMLAGPLIGWSSRMVQGSLEKELLQEAKAQLFVLHDILLDKGFGLFFQEFLSSSWAREEKNVIERMLSTQESALYSDLRQLAEVLIEEENKERLSSEELLNFLKELKKKEELRVRPEEEKGSVAILTIHMSKGLEFDTVFALGLASRHLFQEEISLKREGKEVLTFVDWDDPQCHLALEEGDAEKMRQLYVALTRAKSRVYIPLILDRGKSSLKLGQGSPIDLFCAKIFADHDVIDALKNLGSAASITYSLINTEERAMKRMEKERAVDLVAPPRLILSHDGGRFLSFTGLAQKKTSVIGSNKQESESFNLPLGVETGVIFHRIMEKVFDSGIHSPLQKEKIEKLIARETENTLLESYGEVLCGLICDVLQQPLLDFSLIDVPSSQMQQEMEFTYQVKEGLMKGFIDLVFEMKGKYYLLDWKTNFLGKDYEQESLRAEMEKNDYFLQADLYTEALKRYVKLFDIRPFEECFGGVFYLFVRGKTHLHFFPGINNRSLCH